MALTYVSPGIYRDEKGKLVRGGSSTTQPQKKQNPNKKANPFGLPKNVNSAYQNQVQFSGQAGNFLDQQMQPVFGQVWNPQDTFDRTRFEDQLFSSLTRNTDRDYAREKEQLEQTLANRGIPLNPNDPNYRAHMQYLDEKYQGIRDSARGQALQLGGAEQQDAFNRQLTTRQQNVGDVGTMADLSGVGLGSYLAQQEMNIKKKTADAAISQMAGRGGGSGGAQSSYSSPFNTTTPPGYGG